MNVMAQFGSPWREASTRQQQNHRLVSSARYQRAGCQVESESANPCLLQVDAVVNTSTRIDNTSPPEQDHLTNGKRLSAVDRGDGSHLIGLLEDSSDVCECMPSKQAC